MSCLPCASTGIDALITGRALQLWRGPLLRLWAQVAEVARQWCTAAHRSTGMKLSTVKVLLVGWIDMFLAWRLVNLRSGTPDA